MAEIQKIGRVTFIREHDIKVLNVAGSRGSKEPGCGGVCEAGFGGGVLAEGQRNCVAGLAQHTPLTADTFDRMRFCLTYLEDFILRNKFRLRMS